MFVQKHEIPNTNINTKSYNFPNIIKNLDVFRNFYLIITKISKNIKTKINNKRKRQTEQIKKKNFEANAQLEDQNKKNANF